MASPVGARKRLAVDRQQFLILLVAAVMVGSFCLLILWPKQLELTDLGTAVTRQRDLVSQKVKTSHESIYVSARLAGLRKAQSQLEHRLPGEPRLAEFLQAVTDCTQAEPGVAHEIQQSAPETSGKMAAVPVRLRLTGPYEGVHRCLARVEVLDRLNRFRRVHIQRADDAGSVVAEAEILVYYLPGAAPAVEKTETASETKAGAVQG